MQSASSATVADSVTAADYATVADSVAVPAIAYALQSTPSVSSQLPPLTTPHCCLDHWPRSSDAASASTSLIGTVA